MHRYIDPVCNFFGSIVFEPKKTRHGGYCHEDQHEYQSEVHTPPQEQLEVTYHHTSGREEKRLVYQSYSPERYELLCGYRTKSYQSFVWLAYGYNFVVITLDKASRDRIVCSR